MKDLKIPFFTVLFIVLGLIFYTKLFGPIPFYVNNIQTTKTNLFHAQGTGKATAVPDTGFVTIGISQDSATVADAQQKVNDVMNKIINDLKKEGINEKDIKTNSYNVNPKYDYTMMPSRNNTNGFTVSQNLEINVKPIEKINKVIDIATSDGANIVNQASFGFSDELKKKLENQAREEAVKDARTKAESLAQAAGIRLGRVVDVQENSNNVIPVPVMGKLAPAGEGSTNSTPTTITPGENTITTTVDISYETY